MTRWRKLGQPVAIVSTLTLLIGVGLSVSSAATRQVSERLQDSTSVAPVQAGTAQATGPVAPMVVTPGSIGAVPSHVIWPYYLVLTVQDTGRAFVVPINALILVRIPETPYTHLQYDPNILQPAPQPIRPIPIPAPYEGAPGSGDSNPGTAQPMPMQEVPAVTPISTAAAQPPSAIGSAPRTPYPMPAKPEPTIIGRPAIGPRNFFPSQLGGISLQAVAPGTTDLRLAQIECVKAPCPMIPTYNFDVTITVTGGIVPPPYPLPYPTPYPPVYPPITTRPDVYIGTAYLMQTVQVQPGQIVELELPFLAPQEPISLSFDTSILQPLDGQALNTPQVGGWYFRVAGTGTTQLVVKDNRCLDGSSGCTPSILFSVTIQSGSGGRQGF